MAKGIYTLETSQYRFDWKKQASFREGETSRFTDNGKNIPMGDQIALQEAYSFREVRGRDFKHIRIIIEVQ